MGRVLMAAILLAWLSGCTAIKPVRTIRVGEFTVRLYADRQRFSADIDKISMLIPALRGIGLEAKGFYHRGTKTIYTTDDPLVILHELKHALEPAWRHDPVCGADRCLDIKQ